MSLWQWMNEHLTLSRHRTAYHDAMQQSDDLVEAKRVLADTARRVERGETVKEVRIRMDRDLSRALNASPFWERDER